MKNKTALAAILFHAGAMTGGVTFQQVNIDAAELCKACGDDPDADVLAGLTEVLRDIQDEIRVKGENL